MPKTKVKHFPNRPAKLTASFAKKEYEKLLARVPEAEKSKTAGKWLKLFANWNELKSYVDSEGARIYYAYSKNMANTKLESANKTYEEKIIPAIMELEHELLGKFLNSKHRSQIVASFGEQLVVVANMALKPLAPVNIKLRVRENRLEREYQKLLGSGKVKVRGKEVTLSKCRSFLESSDEDLRKEAFLASRKWFLKNRAKIASFFDKLVVVRLQMAKNLNYKNFIPLGYEQMGRSDYGQKEAAEFRGLVKKYMTPLVRRMNEEHARALGKTQLRPWDSYDPRTTLPLGIVPVKNQLAQAQKVFDRLSPALARHYRKMRLAKAIDLENRQNKRPGAFSIGFSDTGDEAILANSTGDADDIRTLVHEMGHAFQGIESSHIAAVDLRSGTHELSEITSMGMEFLIQPYSTEFFKSDYAKKFIFERWEQAISTICSVTVGDEFQHWVYKNPRSSTGEREAAWIRVSEYYLAPVDYAGYEKYKGLGWYGIHHFFSSPFYYIDYALAETAAMQIAMIDAKDHEKAMKIYMELCRLGGTKSFLAALKHVGLRSPFDESLISDLAAHTREVLGI